MSYSSNILKIPNTITIIAECWKKAEDDLRNEMKEFYPDSGEEYITSRFHEQLARELKSSSQKKDIETAFLKDLEDNHWSESRRKLSKISSGLFADVLHRRHTEGKTGGDL